VIVLGAGAAGLFCGIEAARRGRSVAVLDHARAPGEKIRISGGGRCNFTNRAGADAARYISANPKFAISALSRYRPEDFVARLDRAGIAWHERAQGQLFCLGPARQIVDLLVRDLRAAGGTLQLSAAIGQVEHDGAFRVVTADGTWRAPALVVATGGKSIPKLGASGFGYRIAAQFGVPVTPTRAALVPLVFDPAMLEQTRPLAGLSVPAAVSCNGMRFDDGFLFTHRGLSGPAILQVSSYWREGARLAIDLAPGHDVLDSLVAAQRRAGRRAVETALAALIPARLADAVAARAGVGGRLADLPRPALARLAQAVQHWTVTPVGSEGYRTAEVTLGGVDTAALDPVTLRARAVPGLHFIGEVVDVTGWLGGYNFHWAWSSGWAAGQAV